MHVKISGLQKTSLLDYPDKVSSVIFTQGCNFKCPFCHNSQLISQNPTGQLLPVAEVLAFLRKRRAVLDGLAITGGEPCLQPDLPEFIHAVKELGLLVKLDTNGSFPQVIEELVHPSERVGLGPKQGGDAAMKTSLPSLIDYLSIDIKASLDDYYANVAGVPVDIDLIKQTLDILAGSGIPFELRTTVVPGLHSAPVLLETANQLNELSLSSVPWYLQQFRPTNCFDPQYCEIKPYSEQELGAILEEVQEVFPKVALRV